MTIAIQSTLTRCRHGQPLVVLDSEPFNGMEIRPHDLRRLAQHLTALADMAARLPIGGKHFHPTKVQMGGSHEPAICRPCLRDYSASDPVCSVCTRHLLAEKQSLEVCNA